MLVTGTVSGIRVVRCGGLSYVVSSLPFRFHVFSRRICSRLGDACQSPLAGALSRHTSSGSASCVVVLTELMNILAY